MDWTSKEIWNRYSNMFDKNGKYKSESKSNFSRDKEAKRKIIEDTINRRRVLNEMIVRCNNNESLDDIVNEIAQREEIKKQFDYYVKNGITDLAPIFKNWYNAHEKAKMKRENNDFSR